MSEGKPDKAAAKKRQFLVHIDANLIRRIKILAIDRNVTASSLVEEAMLGYLAAARTPSKDKSGDKP
ncbi:MAG TPA: hypothetical protein VFL55_23745 [Acetobacteraceae bacterium]|nr:hypothetical protein [Acetobacteraceae bacterium]